MSDTIGLKIGLEGEREFKKALADINNSFKVLGSEMSLVASQFDKNDKSAEDLIMLNKVYNKEIEYYFAIYNKIYQQIAFWDILYCNFKI